MGETDKGWALKCFKINVDEDIIIIILYMYYIILSCWAICNWRNIHRAIKIVFLNIFTFDTQNFENLYVLIKSVDIIGDSMILKKTSIWTWALSWKITFFQKVKKINCKFLRVNFTCLVTTVGWLFFHFNRL